MSTVKRQVINNLIIWVGITLLNFWLIQRTNFEHQTLKVYAACFAVTVALGFVIALVVRLRQVW